MSTYFVICDMIGFLGIRPIKTQAISIYYFKLCNDPCLFYKTMLCKLRWWAKLNNWLSHVSWKTSIHSPILCFFLNIYITPIICMQSKRHDDTHTLKLSEAKSDIRKFHFFISFFLIGNHFQNNI